MRKMIEVSESDLDRLRVIRSDWVSIITKPIKLDEGHENIQMLKNIFQIKGILE